MSIWRGPEPLMLASQSTARQQLLRNAGIAFEALPAAIDERAIAASSPITDPGELAALLAREKALHVSRKYPGRVVIGADQTLAAGARLFNKPSGRASAADQLRLLSGKTHELNSAVAVVRDGAVLFDNVAAASMTMRELSDEAIERYLDLAGDHVTTSVGAYQLEGLGVHLFERIEGDHFTILGLPLLPLLRYLRSEGLIAP